MRHLTAWWRLVRTLPDVFRWMEQMHQWHTEQKDVNAQVHRTLVDLHAWLHTQQQPFNAATAHAFELLDALLSQHGLLVSDAPPPSKGSVH